MGPGWVLEEKLRRVGRAFWVEGMTAVSISTSYDNSTPIFLQLPLSSCDSGGAELDLANQRKHPLHLVTVRVQDGYRIQVSPMRLDLSLWQHLWAKRSSPFSVVVCLEDVALEIPAAISLLQGEG